jgi:hypothetical protein
MGKTQSIASKGKIILRKIIPGVYPPHIYISREIFSDGSRKSRDNLLCIVVFLSLTQLESWSSRHKNKYRFTSSWSNSGISLTHARYIV